MPTRIEWTRGDDGLAGETWNPLVGCTRVSAGCERCYAERDAFRLASNPTPKISARYGRTVRRTANGQARWTGRVILAKERLAQPLRWRRPRRVFVNSMSDLFHEAVPDEWIDRVFAVMALAPQHTFIVLTKRAARMRAYLDDDLDGRAMGIGTALGDWYSERPELRRIGEPLCNLAHGYDADDDDTEGVGGEQRLLPLPNVWLLVSCENQATADARIPELLATPAAVRGISAEPLLGPIEAQRYLMTSARAGHCVDIDGGWWHARGECPGAVVNCSGKCCNRTLDWVIVGPESGPGARPRDLAWVRSLRDQCVAAGCAFFWKQDVVNGKKVSTPELDGRRWMELPPVAPARASA